MGRTFQWEVVHDPSAFPLPFPLSHAVQCLCDMPHKYKLRGRSRRVVWFEWFHIRLTSSANPSYDQEIIYDFRAQLQGTGSRSEVFIYN